MKSVLLLRHAKSDHPDPPVPDHERTLNDRGRRAAWSIGRFLSGADQVPDLILSSTARRAVDTVHAAVDAGSWDVPIHLLESLYLPDPAAVLDAISTVPETAQRIMVVGHEPGWSQTAALLTSGGRLRFPTGCLACVQMPVQRWKMVRPGCGELAWLLPPRLLEGFPLQ